jgi:hypothetical protein
MKTRNHQEREEREGYDRFLVLAERMALLYQHHAAWWHARRLAPLAGALGSAWLAATITALSVVDAAFMRSLGWHPLERPTMDWPSGLALGPHGGWMVAAFAGCGALMLVFARGLGQQVGEQRLARSGARLLIGSGCALLLLSFRTDPTLAGGPRTWHGLLHDAAFVLLGLTLLPALVVLGAGFWRIPGWRWLSVYTLATLALAAPAFVLKGALFYGFLGAMAAWFVILSVQLWRASAA